MLKILSGGAANGLVNALRAAFLERTGMEITGDFGAVGGMRDRVVEGEPTDIVILTRAVVEELAEAGKVDADTMTDLGSVATGVAVRSGAPLPDVSDGAALRNVFASADALYCPDTGKATAGIHFARVLADLGIAEEVASRLREYPSGQVAMTEMAKGSDSQPVGCTQVTEILNTPGVDYSGPLPAPHDLSTVYTAAVAVGTASAGPAMTLIELLSAPENLETRRKAGFS